MNPQSCKSKGRRHQQDVARKIVEAFGLEPEDVRSTSMGASGEDLLLSPLAFKQFPYYVECKNVEKLNIWKALEQTEKGSAKSKGEPIVVFRRNRSKTYVAMDFDAFLYVLSTKGLNSSSV